MKTARFFFFFLFFCFTMTIQSQSTLPKKMIVARLEVRPEKADSIIVWASELLEKTPREPGCISYNLYRDVVHKNVFVFVEVYQNQGAVDYHFKQPYLATFRSKRDPVLLHKPQVTITEIPSE